MSTRRGEWSENFTPFAKTPACSNMTYVLCSRESGALPIVGALLYPVSL